ncbi:MAG: transcription antitermination factor NusB [Burkholderiales bacterium]|nr:transcription antitermination factor NusB [Burkholderiales bacterium]
MMKSNRRRSREFALQGLYQWQLAGTDPVTIAAQLGEAEDFGKSDADYFTKLLDGAIAGAAEMEQLVTPLLDRAYKSLSPVERGILLLAGYEFRHCPEVPYRVVINEAIELAKAFGGTDGHKYVNGVLDKMAAQLRAPEVQAARG